MRRKTLHAAIASALLLGGAGTALAAQELICDRQPTSTTAASCMFVPERISSQPGYYVVEPAARERLVVQEPIPHERVVVQEPVRERVIVQEPLRERVVVQDPARIGTPVDAVVMTYAQDSAFPDPSPRNEVQTRVFIPREAEVIQSRPSLSEYSTE